MKDLSSFTTFLSHLIFSSRVVKAMPRPKTRSQVTLPAISERPTVAAICDIGTDYDDVLMLIALSKYHLDKVINLRLVGVNRLSVRKRAILASNLLQNIGCSDIPVYEGDEAPAGVTVPEKDAVQDYALDETLYNEDRAVICKESLQQGLTKLFESAKERGESIFLVNTTALTDLAKFLRSLSVPDYQYIAGIYIQGASKLVDGLVSPDFVGSQNYRFDPTGAEILYEICAKSNIKLHVYSKHAAFVARISATNLTRLQQVWGIAGDYIANIFYKQEEDFFTNTQKPETRYRPQMDLQWYVESKTTWTKSHPGKSYSKVSFEELKPHISIIMYDLLPALGLIQDLVEPKKKAFQYKLLSETHFVAGFDSNDCGINADAIHDLYEHVLFGIE